MDFDITNKSRQYGADAAIACTKVDESNPFNDYITLNVEPTEYQLDIGETKSGKLTITMIKSFIGTEESETAEIEIKCTITAGAKEVDITGNEDYVPDTTEKKSLSGYLVDENNNVLANKNIVIYANDNTYFTKTDETGFYAVNGIEPGNYEIFIIDGMEMEDIKKMPIEDIKNQATIKGEYSSTDNTLTFDGGIKTSKNEPKEITFDTSNLDTTLPPIKVVEGEAYGTLPTVNKEGYTFEGWYLGDELILPSTIVTLKDGQKLTPKFTLTNYTVAINAGTGGSVTPNSLTLNYGTTKTFTVTPSNGYYLSSLSCTNGYTTNAQTGATQTSAQTVTVSNNNNEKPSTCTATFTAVTYSISYTLNSGTNASSNPSSYNVTSNAITLAAPTRAGYTFSGWTGSNGSTAQTSVTIPKGSTGNKTYTANWTAKSYTATLKANTGGSVGSSSVSITYGGTKTFTVTPSSGYYLSSLSCTNGYTTNAKTGTSQTAAQTVTLSNNSKDTTTTCTASFTPITYSISYTMNSGTNSSSNPSSYNVTSNAITLAAPTRTGYTFLGWTGSNGSTAQTSVTIPKGSTGNKSYAANWALKSYTATLNMNSINGEKKGKVNPSSLLINYGGTKTFTVTPDAGYYLYALGCTNGYTTNAKTGTSATSTQTVTLSNNSIDSDTTCVAEFLYMIYDVKLVLKIEGNGTWSDGTNTQREVDTRVRYDSGYVYAVSLSKDPSGHSTSCTNGYTATVNENYKNNMITINNNKSTKESTCIVTYKF